MLIACLVSLTSQGQDITGDWNGVLNVQGIQLRLVFHISRTEGVYSATVDSPDQNVTGIPVTAVSYEQSVLKLSVAAIGMEYEGALGADGNIKGTFKQAGQAFPLDLGRAAVEKEAPVRPQEPAKPYPYSEEEVVFENRQAGVRLAGTLTVPPGGGSFPAVALISGSGAQNRDEELMGHKPFLVIADYLTRNGIAVLRFDDRGTGASSGDFQSATSADLSYDAEAAVQYLLTRKEINSKQIGLIGHSEGGSIAPMIAARSADVAFLVLLAGTGIPGNELLLLQDEALNRAAGASEEVLQDLRAFERNIFGFILLSPSQEIQQTALAERIRELIAEYPGAKAEGEDSETFAGSLARQLANPWMQYFLRYDPAVELEKVKCPVLSLNGEKDLQVPAKANQEAIGAALSKGGNRAVTIREFPGLNHLFQECETGSPAEYGKIEQTISPVVPEEIRNWILATLNK